jgi:hypothetical protein
MAYNFPPVSQIFSDLDKFRDFCRFEGRRFNEADLYRDGSPIWEDFKRYQSGTYRKPKYNNTKKFAPRKF